MKKLLPLIILILSIQFTYSQNKDPRSAQFDFVPGKIIVKLKDNVDAKVTYSSKGIGTNQINIGNLFVIHDNVAKSPVLFSKKSEQKNSEIKNDEGKDAYALNSTGFKNIIFTSPINFCYKNQEEEYLDIILKTNSYNGEPSLTLIIKNISNQDISLFEPSRIIIEHKLDSVWKNVRILYCPCGAPCASPSEEKIISKNETYQLQWNQKEEWCGEMNKFKIPKTVSKKADQGNYRVIIKYKVHNNFIKMKYYPFSL